MIREMDEDTMNNILDILTDVLVENCDKNDSCLFCKSKDLCFNVLNGKTPQEFPVDNIRDILSDNLYIMYK